MFGPSRFAALVGLIGSDPRFVSHTVPIEEVHPSKVRTYTVEPGITVTMQGEYGNRHERRKAAALERRKAVQIERTPGFMDRRGPSARVARGRFGR